MSKVRTALLGYGHLGKWHAQKADGLETCDFVAIVEKSPENQQKAKEAHPNVRIVSDLNEIINDIDAAVIATPTSIHFSLVKELLENKKHIFCEKPLCSDSKEVDALKDLVINDKVLQVGHSERCHEIWESLGATLRELPGKSVIKITRVAAFKGRATDVDVVQDLMIHDIDLVLYLFDKTPAAVKAWGHKIRTGKWDAVTAEIEFTDGSVALITDSRNDVSEKRDFEVVHETGTYYVDLMNQKYLFANNSDFGEGVFVKEETYQRRDHLLIEQENFYDSILNHKQPMVTYDDAKSVIYLMDKIGESLESGERILL
jgi:predicted dehydrogenase